MVVTVTRTNFVGVPAPNEFPALEGIVSAPLQRNGRGVFIRQGAGDIELTLDQFSDTYAGLPSDFADDAVQYVQSHAQNTGP